MESIAGISVKLALDAKEYADGLAASAKETSSWATGLGTAVTAGVTVALASIALLVAGVVGIGVAAWSAADAFQDATNAIIVGTGASGQALDDMEKSVKNLAGSTKGIDKDFEQIGAVLAEVNTRTGLTGQSLEDLTGKMLDYSRLTGGDAVKQTQLVTRVMGDWGIEVENSSELLDKLFGAGQAFGIGVDDLSQKVVQFGAPMRQMGFSIDETIALFGKWEKEGVNAELAIGSLRIAAGKFAKDGIPLQEGLRDTMEAIKNAKTESEGLTIAMETFGARAGPDMAAAIREGRFELDEAVKAIQNTGGSLDDAAKRTIKFSDMWNILKTKALVALIPLGDKLMEIATNAMPFVEQAFDWFEKQLPPIIEQAGLWFDWLVQQIQTNVVPFVQETLIPIFQQISNWLLDEGIPAFLEFIKPIIDQVVPGLKLLGEIAFNIASFILPLLVQWWKFLGEHINIVLPIITAIGLATIALTSPISLVIGAIVLLATAWANNWGGIQEKVQAVMDFIKPYVDKAMKFISETVVKVLTFIQDWWTKHGESVMVVVQALWDFVVMLTEVQLAAIWFVIQVTLAAIQKFWDDWGQTLMTLAALAWDNITTTIEAAMDIIGFIIDAAAALIRGDWQAFGTALKNIWSTAWEAVKTIVSNAKTAIITIIANMISLIRDDYWQPFLDGLKEKWEALWTGLGAAVDSVVGTIRTSLQPVIDLIDGLLLSVSNLTSNLPSLPGVTPRFSASSVAGRPGETVTNQTFNQTNNFGDASGFDSTGQFAQTQALLTT